MLDIIGIDLATKNCGLCFIDSAGMQFNTVGLKDLKPETVYKFTKSLCIIVKGSNIVVDFSWSEIYLPGRRNHAAIKYFIAGALLQSAKNCLFVTPAELRKFYGYAPKTKKEVLHGLVPEEYTHRNEHEKDAWLLAKLLEDKNVS